MKKQIKQRALEHEELREQEQQRHDKQEDDRQAKKERWKKFWQGESKRNKPFSGKFSRTPCSFLQNALPLLPSVILFLGSEIEKQKDFFRFSPESEASHSCIKKGNNVLASALIR